MEQRDFKGVWISKEIWLDTRLNALEKIILVEIDSLDNEDGCSAGNEYLAEFCQCSDTKVSTAVKKLIGLGYIYQKSFDGRIRILKSRLSKNEKQSLNNLKAEIKNFKPININNNIDNIKESKKESNYDKIINSQITNEDLKLTLYEFIKMRKLIKKPMTDRALQLLIGKLHKFANTPDKAIQVLEQSIVNNWQDIYELKNNYIKQKDNGKQASKREYTKEEYENLFDDINSVEI